VLALEATVASSAAPHAYGRASWFVTVVTGIGRTGGGQPRE
jgi:hypothetical protein